MLCNGRFGMFLLPLLRLLYSPDKSWQSICPPRGCVNECYCKHVIPLTHHVTYWNVIFVSYVTTYWVVCFAWLLPGLRSRSRSWSRKESEVFGWSRIPNNAGSRSRTFLVCSDAGVKLDHLITLLNGEFLLKWHSFFWNFCWKRDFMLCTTISTDFKATFHSLYVKESEILERRSRSRKFWKGRSWSRIRIFYLRLRNPGCSYCSFCLSYIKWSAGVTIFLDFLNWLLHCVWFILNSILYFMQFAELMMLT